MAVSKHARPTTRSETISADLFLEKRVKNNEGIVNEFIDGMTGMTGLSKGQLGSSNPFLVHSAA